MAKGQKVNFKVFRTYVDYHFEHRIHDVDHTVIWSEEDSGPSLSITVSGHLTESQVNSVLGIYEDAFNRGRRHQARIIKYTMEALSAGGKLND